MDKEIEILLTWERQIWEATAYNEKETSCNKTPSDPSYGITASGTLVAENRTVAVGPNIPFGTPVYIPSRKNKQFDGIHRSEDRGDAIGIGKIDLYIEDDEQCIQFGRKKIEVYIPREVLR